MLKVLGKLPSPHQYSHDLLFLVGLSELGIHSCDLKLCPPKNVNTSREQWHLEPSMTYTLM